MKRKFTIEQDIEPSSCSPVYVNACVIFRVVRIEDFLGMSSQISELPVLPEPECTKTDVFLYNPTIRPGPKNKPSVEEKERQRLEKSERESTTMQQ